MRRLLFFWSLLLIAFWAEAQELFPHAEPASTMPKGIPGFRFMYNNYKEATSNRYKNWYGLRFMYGLTSKWTVMTTLGIGNHHFQQFPTNVNQYFFNHHLNTSPPAPTIIEGINVYSKYRFYSFDGYQEHFRMAFVAQACKSFIAHDEAEPTLMTDNSGYGVGLIATYLKKRFAVSATAGYIHPFTYYQKDIDFTFRSGQAVYLEVSSGYRLLPVKYNSYDEVNLNFYTEWTLKQYGEAYMQQGSYVYTFSQFNIASSYFIYGSLINNFYIDCRFYIQLITNSNTRIDFGVATPIVSRAYNYWYPMYTIQYQTYLFPKRNKPKLYR